MHGWECLSIDCGASGRRRLMGAALAPAPASAKDIVINMAAPDWLPTRFMQEEFDKTYKAKSGNNVKLVIDFIPWGASISASPRRSPRARRNIDDVTDSSGWATSSRAVITSSSTNISTPIRNCRPSSPICTRSCCRLLVLSLQVEHYYGFPQFPDNLVTGFRKDLFCNETGGNFKKAVNQTRPAITTNGKTSTGSATRTSASFQRKKATSSATAWPTTFLRHRLSGGQAV